MALNGKNRTEEQGWAFQIMASELLKVVEEELAAAKLSHEFAPSTRCHCHQTLQRLKDRMIMVRDRVFKQNKVQP